MPNFLRNPSFEQIQIRNKPQSLEDHQISKEIQITNELQASKQPQISKLTHITDEP